MNTTPFGAGAQVLVLRHQMCGHTSLVTALCCRSLSHRNLAQLLGVSLDGAVLQSAVFTLTLKRSSLLAKYIRPEIFETV